VEFDGEVKRVKKIIITKKDRQATINIEYVDEVKNA
jgi:hypothetical protein